MQNVNSIFNNVVNTQHTQAHTTKYYCVQQAAAQNKANASKYTAQQLAFANTVLNNASSAFLRSKCYLNLRNKFISVKVANVQKADLASNAVAQFAQFCTQHNIVVKQTQNAIIFNIM